MLETQDNTPHEPQVPKMPFAEKRLWVIARRIGQFTGRTLGIFVLLFLFFAFLIQLPPVQRWGIEKTTSFLSKELNTKVNIGDFRLDFFDEISVGDVYIGNQNAASDTLLSVGRLRFDVNYFDFMWGIIQLDAVKIENVKVRLLQDVGQYENNFQFIVDYFDPPKKTKTVTPQKTTDFRFGQIHLRHIDFVSDDRVGGEKLDIKLEAADIHTNIINLPHRIIDLTRVNVFKPYCHITETKANPLPPRPKKEGSDIKKEAGNETDTKPFQFLVGAVSAENGVFKLDNYDIVKNAVKKIRVDSIIDFDHLNVNDINIAIHNFMFAKDEWTGVIDGVSLKEKSGFVLTKLTVGDAKVTPRETALYGLQIETPYTVVGDTFRMIYPSGYPSFLDYNNKVTMDGRIHTSKVRINDVLYFSDILKTNPFFHKNRSANARIEANIFGKINSLKVRPFNISLGDGFVAQGTFESHNLDNPNEAFINLNLKELQTNMPNLQQLIPDFKPGATFNQLGNLKFTGEFVGFFNDFTANGRLQTALGGAVMDMKLKPPSDTDQPFYSGNLALDKFDVGALTGISEVGKISMKTKILRGSGFSGDKIALDLVAVIDNFQYKNYDYHDLSLSGKFSHKQFNGQFDSKDENISLNFDGFVNFASEVPVYKFKSDIRRVNFQKLNLLKDDLAVVGVLNLDLMGDKLSNISGTIDAHNLQLIKNQKEVYPIDTLIVSLLSDMENGVKNGRKTFSINSDILTAQINGLFSIEEIPNAFKSEFTKFHPLLAKDLGLLPTPPPFVLNGSNIGHPHQEFEFDIFVNNTKNWTYLIDPQLDTLRNIKIKGDFNDAKQEYYWKIETPETHRYGDIKIVEFGSRGTSKGDFIDWNLNTTAIKIGDDKDFRQLAFQNTIKGDTVELGLTSYSFSTALGLDTIELNAVLMRQDSSYKMSFGSKLQSRLTIFGESWEIDRENSVFIDKDKIKISGFDMRHNDQSIALHSLGNRGLKVDLQNFDIRALNKKIKDSSFVFSGKYRVYGEIEDVFKMENFGATAMLDSLVVTGEKQGVLRIRADGKSLKEPIHANISLITDTSSVVADGNYYPSVWEKHLANSIDFNLALTSYPFKTLKLLISDGASGFKGRVDGSVRVEGPLDKINTEGSLRLRDAEITIDYLKVPLIVRDETVKITNTRFEATGAKVYDKFGNVATIQGGLTHNRFQNFGLDVRALSKNFLFLNTTAKDNSLFYGLGIGEGDIRFSGNFDRPDIYIKAKAGKGRDEKGKEVITNITFPFKNSQSASDTRSIVFKTNTPNTSKQDSLEAKNKVAALNGVSLDMQLELTPEAEATLIFDEVAGDNIKARGTGNFRINIDRSGEIGMNGEYRIERGDYLFTLFRLVNKNFAIKRGGTIRWTGTPFDATLNIEAEYKDLTTSPYNFVSEYVNRGDGTAAESRKPTKVGLTLKLTGEMLKPDINFKMSFPQLQGTLKTYAESKLRILQQDPNELNKQAFGLIVVGSFLPSDIGVSQIRSGGINTLTETASNVVSNMLNNLVKEYVAGLDIQVGYNYYQVDVVDPTNPLTGRGQQFRAHSSYAINDRITISGGVDVNQGGFVTSSSTNNSNVFVGGDFYIDYDVSADRRLKLRVSYIRDQDIQGRRDKPAVGLRFQQEFNSWEEFLESLRKKKVKNTEGVSREGREQVEKGK
jgi:TamB, inner membrane protein subunit of TAM complex